DICGGGGSGRNGGFVLSWWSKFGSLAKLCGPAEALRLAEASARAVSQIGEFCVSNGIDARFHEAGYLWAATNPSQLGAWTETIEELDRLDAHPFLVLDRDQAAARSGSDVHIGAAFEASGAIVQPALLARGLRRVAIEAGVRIFERSPMVRLNGTGVVTPRGAVDSGRVVLAMNAWAVRFRALRRKILVVGSDMIATEPIPERLGMTGWE